jgi:Tat protein secretion system quality control protein TatD with DNase activity
MLYFILQRFGSGHLFREIQCHNYFNPFSGWSNFLLESFALESDSPALGPDRNQRNEPANLTHTLQMVAKIKGVSENRVREVTRKNAQRLFWLQ